MTLHLSDLPKSVRDRIADQEGHAATARTTRQADSERGAPTKGWRCHPCGATFTVWARAQRHMDDAHGGGRLELVL